MTLDIRDVARVAPDAIALIADGTAITYRELAERVARVVTGLHARGLGGGGQPPVALTPRIDVESVARILGCIAAGVTFVPLHPRLSSAEREALVRGAGVGWELPELVLWPDEDATEIEPIPDSRALA
ncbi:MAG: AMP-binding protein, partial [Polyangiaceae bacterium]|nr:AMP-binding protein [Polyangiaceae bacterium]